MGTVQALMALTFAALAFPVLVCCSPEKQLGSFIYWLCCIGRAHLWRSHPLYRLAVGSLLGIP